MVDVGWGEVVREVKWVKKFTRYKCPGHKTSKSPGDVMYSMMTTVNTIVYLKVTERVDLENFHHKKKMCNSVWDGCYATSSMVISSQYTKISAHHVGGLKLIQCPGQWLFSGGNCIHVLQKSTQKTGAQDEYQVQRETKQQFRARLLALVSASALCCTSQNTKSIEGEDKTPRWRSWRKPSKGPPWWIGGRVLAH